MLTKERRAEIEAYVAGWPFQNGQTTSIIRELLAEIDRLGDWIDNERWFDLPLDAITSPLQLIEERRKV